jgi:intracellular multiplication protein IcmV
MAMGIIKRFFKSLVNFPAWMGFKQLKQDTSTLVKAAKSSFKVSQSQRVENFDQATSRLGLTETDLSEASKRFKYLAIFYVILGFAILSYAIYLLSYQHYQGGVVACCIAFFTFSLAFRNHFWFFQTQVRKLGCTPKEWLKFLIGKQ